MGDLQPLALVAFAPSTRGAYTLSAPTPRGSMRVRSSIVLSLFLLGCPKTAPEATPTAAGGAIPDPATDAVIPSDPSVRMGVLDNGLHWYVEENARPQERAVLRLVVKVGSAVEDDDQQGLAHFLEHMAFNGTENFQGNALIDYMESIGMEFGAHLNAYTSFDETVYLLTVPTDDPTLLDTGLAVLRDQAGNMLLTEEEIERERGVVLEEWRLSLGAQNRIQRQMWANSFPGSRYAARFPIGTEESLRTFSPDALRRFYGDWYRPELMGVIAVGDFDADQVQQQIESLFADLDNPTDARPHAPIDVPAFDEQRVFVVTDPEATNAFVVLDDQYDGVEGETWADYRDGHLLPSVAFGIINERLADAFREPTGPVTGAQVGPSRINAAEEETTMFVGVRADRTLDAVQAVAVELERLRRYGVTEGELARAKANVAAQYEAYGKTADTTDSNTHADELQRVFLEGEGMPGIPVEVAMVETWLPGITRDEVSAVTRDLLQQGSQVVQVVVPEREGFTVPSVEDVQAALVLADDLTLEAPEEADTAGPLVAAPPPVPTTPIAGVSGPDDHGMLHYTLRNGVEVHVLPTDYADDEVVLVGRSHGGLSLVDDDRFLSATAANGILANSGLGTFTAEELGKRLAGVRAQARAGLSPTQESVGGSASADDVETMLQLVWLHFQAPRFTEEGEARFEAAVGEQIASRERSPDRRFQDARRVALVGEGPRVDPYTADDLTRIDRTVAESVWRERFADPSDFTWMIVGDVDPATLEPLIDRWLGQLPVPEDRFDEAVQADRVTGLRDGSRTVEVEEGTTPRARVTVTWHGPMQSTWLTRNRMMALSDIVGGRLRTVLREDLGGVYGVSLSGGVQEHPEPNFRVTLSFACDPERVDELLQAADDQFEAVMAQGVTDEEIAVEQEQNRRDREQRVRTNSFWAGAYVGTIMRGENVADLHTWDARNDSLTSAELQALARTVWGKDTDRVQVVQVPEGAE